MIIKRAKTRLEETAAAAKPIIPDKKIIETPITISSKSKVLLYYVAFGEGNIRLAEMSTKSLYYSGFRDNCIVFTDRPHNFRYANTIDVTKSDKLSMLDTKTRPMDYWYMRMCLDLFVDLSRYEKVIYSDTDILFFSSEFVERFGDSIYVQGDRIPMSQQTQMYGDIDLTDEQSICDGFFSIPSKFYGIYPIWRQAYISNSRASDQESFNYVLFKHKAFKWEFIPITSWRWGAKPRKGKRLVMDVDDRKGDSAFAVHYWNGTKPNMPREYNRFIRKEGEPPASL